MSLLQAVKSLLTKPDPAPPRPVSTPISEAQFTRLFPKADIAVLPHLNRAMARFKIDSPVRVAAFLAQIGHESAGLTVVSENLNYSADGLAATWPTRFRGSDGKPNPLAVNYHRKPQSIANYTYANRMGNGTVDSGDGWRFRGRGFIQTTGRTNYAVLAAAVGVDFLSSPELLEKPEYASLSAAYFWHANGLNELADSGVFDAITKRINGGTHGTADRRARWELAKRVINGYE